MAGLYPTSLLRIWDENELFVMIFFSLCPYVLLTFLGRRRDLIASSNLATVLFWLAYNVLDKTPGITIGILFDKQLRPKNVTADPNLELTVFWVPFVLVHNGFPDTVTSYTLADNETWSKYLLTLFFGFSFSLDVVLKSWSGTCLGYLSVIFLFIGGWSCLERAWAQRSASQACFRNSVYSRMRKDNPNSGQSIARNQLVNEANNFAAQLDNQNSHDSVTILEDRFEASILPNRALFLRISVQKFARLSPSSQDIETSRLFFQLAPFDVAFHEINCALQSSHDLLCTKVFVFHCKLLKVFRCLIFTSSIAASTIACFIIQKPEYCAVYKAVTCVIVILTLISQFYAAIHILRSDYMAGLSRGRKPIFLGQYNLIQHCLHKNPTKCILNFNRLLPVIKNFCRQHSVVATDNLLKETHSQLVEKSISANSTWLFNGNFPWNSEAELWKTIICLHITTSVCYFGGRSGGQPDFADPKREMSKWLSNYMLYILHNWPALLGNSFRGIEETCDQVILRFLQENYPSTEGEACNTLFSWAGEGEVAEDGRLSILANAIRYAYILRLSETKDMWETIFSGWIALLCSAASKASEMEHAEHLLQADELLTHIWLLMACLNLSGQIDQGCTIGGYQRASSASMPNIVVEANMGDVGSTGEREASGMEGVKVNETKMNVGGINRTASASMEAFRCLEGEGGSKKKFGTIGMSRSLEVESNQTSSIGKAENISIGAFGCSEDERIQPVDIGKTKSTSMRTLRCVEDSSTKCEAVGMANGANCGQLEHLPQQESQNEET